MGRTSENRIWTEQDNRANQSVQDKKILIELLFLQWRACACRLLKSPQHTHNRSLI